MTQPAPAAPDSTTPRARRDRGALRRLSSAAALVDIGIGAIVVVGWTTGARGLTTFLPDGTPAKAATALLVMLAGVALLLSRAERPAQRTIVRGLGLAIVVLTGATCIEYISGASLGIDSLIPSWDVAGPGTPYPGRMALHAAAGLLMGGLALASLGTPWRRRHPAELLGLGCALVGAFDLLAFLYGAPSVRSIGLETQVSLPIGLGQLVLGVGIVAADTDHSLPRLLRDPGMAGRAGRRILPAVLIIAPIGGWLEVTIQRAELAADPVATMGMVAGVAVLVFAVAWWALVPGRAAEDALRRSEVLLHSSLDAVADAFVICSSERDERGAITGFRVAFANRAAGEFMGRAPGALVGHWIPERMPSLSGSQFIETCRRVVETAEPWAGNAVEFERPGPDGGERRLVDVSIARFGDGILATWRDVTELREAQVALDLEKRFRDALAESLRDIPADATLEESAQAICDQLVTLPFVDVASVDVFLGSSDVMIIGHSAPSGHPVSAGDHLPKERAVLVRERAASGPWAEHVEPDPTGVGWLTRTAEVGLKALAFGPIVHGDHIGGTVVIGTYDDRFADILVRNPSAFLSFSTTSSALLAERLHEMRRLADVDSALAMVLASAAFHPVFQPIVDLEAGDVVGYEALTRFDSGQRPDLVFADAWSVGRGSDLEIATIEAAVLAAKRLPAGRWLDLNASPRLLVDAERLTAIIRSADRPIVLEITEHEIIEDYDVVRNAIRALGHDVRLAVDDAGAGVANFGHIIDLHPDFVKLDISLVRRVNADLGRQAMVAGMHHFSLTAGCRLIAEGVETQEEARTLTGLGVEFGQGYLFGHPEPVEAWSDAGATRRVGHDPTSPTVPGGQAYGDGRRDRA